MSSSQLDAAIEKATTAREILIALAGAIWADAHHGADCPPFMVPNVKVLATWLQTCSPHGQPAVVSEFQRLLKLTSTARPGSVRLTGDSPRPAVLVWSEVRRLAENSRAAKSDDPLIEQAVSNMGGWQRFGYTDDDKLPELQREFVAHYEALSQRHPRPAHTEAGVANELEFRHRLWAAEDEHGRHPLAPLVRAWQAEQPISVEPERRQHGIMPAMGAARIKPQDQPTLPGLPLLTPPTVPGVVQAPDNAYLPGFAWEGLKAEPALILTMFDQAGGEMGGGRGAPAELRIFVEGLLSIPTYARNGQLHKLHPISVQEIIVDWLQWDRKHYRPTGKWTGLALQRAFRKVNSLFIPLNERGGLYFPLLFRAASGWTLNDAVVFLAQVSPGSEVGPPVDRNIWRILSARDVVAARMYLSLCFEWDRYGSRRGRLIRPTRPVAERDAAGYLLDAHGQIVTGKGGVPVKSPYHRRAIHTGAREPNPAADRYPPYTADDLVRLGYGPKAIQTANLATKRQQRKRAEAAAELVEQAGGATLQRLRPKGVRGGFYGRILPPDLGRPNV